MSKNVKKSMTLKSVAAALNVSTATISNAFNRPDQLSQALRRKILTECKKLGYHGPNATARTLRRGQSDAIGVMLSDPLAYYFTDPVASQFLTGIAEVLEQNRKQLLLLSGAESEDRKGGIESLADGFIVYGSQDENQLFMRVLETGKPVVTVDFDYKDYPSVNIDNYQAAFNIAHYLFNSGCTRPVVLGIRLIDSKRIGRIVEDELFEERESISRRRLNGYLDAAKDAGVDLPLQQIWHIPQNNHQLALQAASEVLSMYPLPDCVICMSDVVATAVLNVAHDRKIRVPDQLKVVGFDDIPEASRISPSLTTVSQHSIEKGRMAAKKVLSGGPQAKTKTLLPTQLTVRQSS
ncbi:LacI family DNA-binding transcriptional regulator [Neptunicella marina]|nr:LacI family DNA-binding transcriptional regulator [Neptunicella marina]